METLFLGLRVLVSLGAVLGLLWFLQRRFSRTLGSAGANQPAVRVVSRQPLGPKASLVVVETDGQRLLLGVAEGSVNLLHTTEVPPESEPVPATGFAASLEAAQQSSASYPEDGHAADPYSALPPRRAGRGAHALPSTHPVPAKSALAGSILAPETWRQAGAALGRGRKR
ncbi:flagellar biosynthetic protein FliO [Arthrobacter sp. zg-Y895]|uniref:flagellar biosynthetic protein FliO n=1 Tax=Arthrobacter sp. zg-Y895 TaxID=2886933 RepID=UPI001D13486F|nr:flagellar biosynthetic protein FliO [Arthrobacter sp. zg-Y895]